MRQAVEGAVADEEVVLDVAHHALVLALGAGARGPTGPRREAVVPGQIEKARIEADAVRPMLQDRRLLIVDEHFGRDVAVRVVERVQFRRQQLFRPVVVFVRQEPALLRVVREALRGILAPEEVVRPEVIAGQAFEELAQRAGMCSEF